MALPVSWNGTGLSAGTLTTSSAGTGDTPLGSIGGGTNTTIDASGTDSPRIRFAGGLANVYAGWNSTALGTISSYVISAYFELDTISSAQWSICSGNTSATVQWRLDVAGTGNSAPGHLRLRNTSAQLAESSQALAGATLYRLEVVGNGSTVTATVYTGTGSTVAAGPISGTASATSVDNVRFGNFSSQTTGPIMYFDGLSVAALASASAALAGDSSLTAAATLSTTGAAALTGSSVLAAGAVLSTSAAVALAAGSTLTAAGAVVTSTVVTLTGGSALGVTRTVTTPGAVALTATSVLQATATLVFPPSNPPATRVGVAYPPPGNPTFFVAVRDADLNRVGAISPIALTFTPRFNDVGEWSLQVYADSPNADRLRQPGAGVLIYRGDDMTLLMSGPVGTRKLSQTDEGLLLEVSGPDDNVWIASRLAYQMPSRTVANQGTPTTGALTHDRRTGAAETVVKGYVRDNAGQSAQADRQVVVVVPVATPARGDTVTGAARMTPLLDLIRGLCATGGIGWGVRQVGTLLSFDVYTPTDRTLTARFSSTLGNLEAFEFTEAAPSSSYVISGGQGQGTARAFDFTEDTDAITAWPRWRFEKFVDQRQAEEGNGDEIAQARLEELVSGGPQTSLSIRTRDTPQVQYGRDFNVGDQVTVEPIVGSVVKEVLREVTVTWSPDGTTVVSQVGTSETTGTSKIIRLLRRLASKSAAVNTVE